MMALVAALAGALLVAGVLGVVAGLRLALCDLLPHVVEVSGDARGRSGSRH